MMEDTTSSNTITEEEWSFVNARGQSLFALEVLPAPANAARCVVVFAHGEGEHCRRKLHIFRAWAARGIACFAYDMHGYGASPPALGTPGRGLISNIGHSVDDMADFSAAAAARRPELDPLPWIAAGYDVGGLIAALMVLRWQDEWTALALYAPRVAPASFAARVQNFLGPVLDFTVGAARCGQPIVPARLYGSNDGAAAAAAVADYLADPLCMHGATRARTSWQISKGFDVLASAAAALKLPLYCEHPKGDLAANWEDSREFCASVGSTDVAWVCPDGGCHDGLSAHGPAAAAAAARMADFMLKTAAEKAPRRVSAASGSARISAASGGVGGGRVSTASGGGGDGDAKAV